MPELKTIFELTNLALGPKFAKITQGAGVEEFISRVSGLVDDKKAPAYVIEIAEVEAAIAEAEASEVSLPAEQTGLALNPTLHLFNPQHIISELFSDSTEETFRPPEKRSEWIAVWRDRSEGTIRVSSLRSDQLLAIKLVLEEIPFEQAAEQGAASIGVIDAAVFGAINIGLLISPGSKLRRPKEHFPDGAEVAGRFYAASVFTLQWHITHACDLHCKHCYDRSDRSPLNSEQGLKILDGLRDFVWNKSVKGHVCFSGGNPFMHPSFYELYQGAVGRGFAVSILGNPVSEKQLQKLCEIRRPSYYQVSLEGLEEHNDRIRGAGFYRRVIDFLPLLRKYEIESHVMLTLTSENIDQVLPLAEKLDGVADHFTFNRLSQFGEGAALLAPGQDRFEQLLEEYVAAAPQLKVLAYKDNLINIVRTRKKLKPFGGCTGFGCGAAFNFLAVLPDGAAHACRKFPSPVGNILAEGLENVYNSETAERYRRGCRACDGCSLRFACGGCLAVAAGRGLDPFSERDPNCFYPDAPRR